MVWDILSWMLLSAGSAMIIIGGIGLIRLPDFFSRLHAVSIPDTVGAGLVTAGLMIQVGLDLVALKLLMILLFLLFTGPTSTHALAKAALHGQVRPRAQGDPDTSSAAVTAPETKS